MTGFAGAARLRGIVAAGLLGMLLPGAALAEDGFSFKVTAYKQAVAESLGEDEGLAAFYRARAFEPIWTGAGPEDAARRQALAEAFSLAAAHGLPRGRYNAEALKRRLASATNGRARGLLEVEISRLFLDFAHDLQSGVLDDPGRIISGIKRAPARRADDVLLASLTEGDPRAAFRALVPASPEYTRLLRAKLSLEHRIAHGGWGPTVPARALEPGSRGEAVVALRNRLVAMGYMAPSLSMTYDSRMIAAVQLFQETHGLEPDGTAGPATLREVNVSPERRLASVMVAMERERWLNLPDGRGARHVLVNLVDFHARIIDNDKLTFKTRSIIGHQDMDRRTPEFSDVMEHMVINPYWYVPRSIIVGEYLPLLRSNPGAVGHLEIIDARGRVVSRGQSFAQFSGRTFPFSMRQPPGPRNALGSVKFMFPNPHNIYLHDTPTQHLFTRDVRTFSHGCIRLDDPHEFAYALLAPQEADPVGTFQRILRSGENTKVLLEQPIPVHLIYRTAFTEAKGPVHYRDDVYGRDMILWRALQTAGVEMRIGEGS